MNRIVEFALHSKMWVLLIFFAIVAVGGYSAFHLPIDAVPDITNVQVMINTKTGALAPAEIETAVTYPVESELSGIQNVEEIRSISKYGLSQITVVFQDGMNLYFARQLIAERLAGLLGNLPAGMAPQMGPVSTGLGEILMYEVRAKKGSALAAKPAEARLRYLRMIQDWQIRRELKTVNGVAEVDSNGGYAQAIQINLDPVMMEQYGVSVERIMDSLSDIGINRGGGYVESDQKRIIVRTRGRFDSVEQLKNIPIRLYALGAPIRLSQIASVKEESLPRVGATTSNGQETVLGTVLMRIGSNSRTVSQEAMQRIQTLSLPKDVEINVLYARSFLVDATIRTVLKNLTEGAILVITILLIILGNFRAAIIVAMAIPISMLFSVSGMLYGNISANLMSLGAIDFGLLVDGSVVMIENIIRKMEERHGHDFTKSEKIKLIVESAREVSGPVVAGLIIIMIVYIPILSLTGIEGKMFRPMAATVLLALMASLVVAIILMPVLAYLFLKPPKKAGDNKLFAFLTRMYRPLLKYSMNHKWYLVGPTLLFAALSILAFTRLGADFIPQLDEGDMVIGVVRNADISLPESVEKQCAVEKAILKFPEVEKVFSRMGTPESATDPMGINFADTFVILKKDKSQWPAQSNGDIRTKEELYAAIEETIHREVPDQSLSPTQPIEMRFNEMLEGSRADVTLRIFGSDLKKLMGLVGNAEEILSKIDGVNGVAMDELTALRQTPVIDFKLDHRKMTEYGIHSSNVNQTFETAFAGEETGQFYTGDIRIPVMVRMAERYRNDLKYIDRVPLDMPGGGTVPLSKVTKMEMGNQVTTIARYNSKRYAAVAIYLKDRDVQGFVDEAKAKIQSGLKLPEGFTTTWGGQFKNLEKARMTLAIILPITLAVIFLILLRTFNDFLQTVLVFLTIPFAATGGVLFLYMRDISFSISAAVGFIALTGIAILNGMVLVSFFNHLRQEGGSLYSSVFEGAMIRLRPVLMTALVASLGFIPMAFNTGPGSEVQRPLATVVIGGLVTATALTLLLLPTLYYTLEKWREQKKGIFVE